jgi:hypothetical protein
MVQQRDTFGDIEWMMVRDRNHAGAQSNPLRTLRRGGQEHLGRSHQFPSDRMVFADP